MWPHVDTRVPADSTARPYSHLRCCALQSGYAGGKKCAKAVRLTPDRDFSKMRVGQMKDILRDRGVSCPECAEKQDFVAKLLELARASS